MKDAAERVWKWVFEFNIKGNAQFLDDEQSKLYDQKLKWLIENETDDNILRSYAVIKNNVPLPQNYSEGKTQFEERFGKQIIDGPRGGPWMEGFARPSWAKKLKTPLETLAEKLDK
jgi:hypothetical protein